MGLLFFLACGDDEKPLTAITWLNESSSASFYLVKLEAIRIGDSLPAPMLTLIVGPSEESEQAGETKKELNLILILGQLPLRPRLKCLLIAICLFS